MAHFYGSRCIRKQKKLPHDINLELGLWLGLEVGVGLATILPLSSCVVRGMTGGFGEKMSLHHVLQRDHISRRFHRFSAQKLRRDLFARHRSVADRSCCVLMSLEAHLGRRDGPVSVARQVAGLVVDTAGSNTIQTLSAFSFHPCAVSS